MVYIKIQCICCKQRTPSLHQQYTVHIYLLCLVRVWKDMMLLRPVWKWFGHSMNYNHHIIVFHIKFNFVQPVGHPNNDHEMAVSGWTFLLRFCSKAFEVHNHDAIEACEKMIWSFHELQSPHATWSFYFSTSNILLAWRLSKLCHEMAVSEWTFDWELNHRLLKFLTLMPLKHLWKWFGHSMNYNHHMIVFQIQFNFIQSGGHPKYDHEMAVSG